MKCPHCETEIKVSAVAELPPAQRMSICITHEHPLLAVELVAGTLSNFEKLMQATARELGAKCHVFVVGIRQEPGRLTFDLLIADSKDNKKAQAQADLLPPLAKGSAKC